MSTVANRTEQNRTEQNRNGTEGPRTDRSLGRRWITVTGVILLLGSSARSQSSTIPLSFMLNDPYPEVQGQFGNSVHIVNLDEDPPTEEGGPYGELLVGAPNIDVAGSPDAGVVRILHGPVTETPRVWSTLYPPNPQNAGCFGFKMASGDFNNDGSPDVAVSSIGVEVDDFPSINYAYDQGAVIVFLGPWTLVPGGAATAAQSITIVEDPSQRHNDPTKPGEGNDKGDRFGFRIAVGDLNDDGCDDLVIGSPYSSVPTVNYRYAATGQAYIYWGDLNTPLSTFVEITHPVEPLSDNAYWGWDVAVGNVRDHTLNGRDDLAIGSVGRTSNGHPEQGDVVFLYDYSTAGFSGFDRVFHFPNTPDGVSFGVSIALGYYNSDNFLDVAIGADGATGAQFAQLKGDVAVKLSGPSFPFEPGNFQFNAPIANGDATDFDRFGHEVRFIDHDGDGIDSIFCSSPWHDLPPIATGPVLGEGRVFQRNAGPPVAWVTINDASPEHGLNGPDGLKRWGFGYAMGKGRLSNDEKIDLAVGNPSATYQAVNLPGSGEVRVVVYVD